MDYIELTNEEYDAVMEAREELESLEEFKSDIKRHYDVKRLINRNSHLHKKDAEDTGIATGIDFEDGTKEDHFDSSYPVHNMKEKKIRDKANKYASKIAKYSNKAFDAERKKNSHDYEKYGEPDDDYSKGYIKNLKKAAKYYKKLIN